MKNIISLTLLGLSFLATPTCAQFSFTPHLTFNRTALPNAADTSSSSLTLEYRTTYRLAGGVDIGYRFETSFGLSGLFFGLDYTPVAQNYNFDFHPPAGFLSPSFNYKRDFSTSLKYLRGTVSAEFTVLGGEDGFRLTISPGFYIARLLTFHDGERIDGKWREGTANQTFFLMIPIFDSTLEVHEVIGLAYRKWDYGPRLALGAEIPLSENVALTASLHSTYGLSNAESEDAQLALVNPSNSGGIFPLPASAWYYREGRFILPIDGGRFEDKRTVPTHTFTAGASIGLRFIF